ncbi:MAG: hypothetical protein ACT4QB_02415 [Gammaproteobacteria bacterium]
MLIKAKPATVKLRAVPLKALRCNPTNPATAFEEPMKNVEMHVEGNILTIQIDLSKEYGPSSSGKTIIIASTEGNVPVPEREEKIGLNVYRKK